MSQRAAALADEFETLHAEVLATVAAVPPASWSTPTAVEHWPAGFGFYHLAEGYELIRGWIEVGVAGREPVALDPAANDASNAVCLAAHGNCTQAEVLALLNARGPRLAALVRGLTDAHLASMALSIPDGTQRSVEQVASGPMLGHIRAHLASVKAVTGLS